MAGAFLLHHIALLLPCAEMHTIYTYRLCVQCYIYLVILLEHAESVYVTLNLDNLHYMRAHIIL